MKSCDDAFREQLEAKEKVYDDNLRRLAAGKDKEIHLSSQKVSNFIMNIHEDKLFLFGQVLSVEEEMRTLLQEVARERKNMETKFGQLTMVMQDLQMNFSDTLTKH